MTSEGHRGNSRNAGRGTKPTILIVDDDLDVREVVSFVLNDEGYQVMQADSAETALSLMKEHQPDLILSDAMMPGMGGFDFCREVRATPVWCHIPFIFLTAKGLRSDIRHGMDLGADDYLPKPFEAEELLSAVGARLVRAAETQAAISRASEDLRDTILRTLSHEFRTPLALIVGYTDLLAAGSEETSDEGFHEFLHGLRCGAERLNNLVEDFLLLSKLETGSMPLANGPIPMRMTEPDKIVDQVMGEFADRAEARCVSLAFQPGTPGAAVAGNEKALKEIVRRLLDNAIRFSQQEVGRVLLTTWQDEEWWVVDITDNGIGLPREALSWIFQAFRQVDRYRMEQQGAGLGLAIVRGLVELQGGRVDVESEPGSGSTFTVRLPLSKT
jgi:signal transduction histidine kinase